MGRLNEVGPKQSRIPQASRPEDGAPEQFPIGWSAARATMYTDEKKAMAHHFCQHDLLVKHNQNPSNTRETAATFLATAGTSPYMVVRESLAWIKANSSTYGQFAIMWYTPASLVAAALRDFRTENHHLRSAADLFLFPGRLNPDVECVVGPTAVRFTKLRRTKFTYSLLGAYAFDMASGKASFHYPEEVGIQRACAFLPARHKFLFLDSSKFEKKEEGEPGYSIRQLLNETSAVTIYTVASANSNTIAEDFHALAESILITTNEDEPIDRAAEEEGELARSPQRMFRLCVVGTKERPAENIAIRGYLRRHSEPRNT